MTASMTADGGGEVASPTFEPSKEWLDIYLEQATTELIKAAKRYARLHAKKVRFVRHVPDWYEDEMVLNVLEDTLFRKIKWDPERVSLKKHVLDAIKSRTRHDYVRALKFTPLRLDDPGVMHAAENHLVQTTTVNTMVSAVCATTITQLRELAGDDADVHLVIDALIQLVTKKRDILKLTGLTTRRYEAARKRLHRLTLKLPASLRETARMRVSRSEEH